MKEFSQNFSKILDELFLKFILVGIFSIFGGVIGTAFTLAVLGITPQRFFEILAPYNSDPALEIVMVFVVSIAAIWQYLSMFDDIMSKKLAV